MGFELRIKYILFMRIGNRGLANRSANEKTKLLKANREVNNLDFSSRSFH